MTEKYNYYYDEYYKDVGDIVSRYKNISNIHIVGVYRGSLPIATHLSNVLECPMSIIKFQSRDGEDEKAEWLLNMTNDKKLHPKFFPKLIVIDDVYDTGKTFRAIKKLPEFIKNPDYSLDDHWESMGKNIPLGRVGEAEEVGDVMCFLASSKASYVTGTAINVDGGTAPVI